MDPCSAADINQATYQDRHLSFSSTCVLVLSIARETEVRTSVEGYPRYEQSYSGSLPWISTAKVLEVDERP